jgi:cytochrome c-type biogenesis protein CcmH/NrfG
MTLRPFTASTLTSVSDFAQVHLRRVWLATVSSLLLLGVIGYSWLGAKETEGVSPFTVKPPASASISLLESLSPATASDPLAQAESRISAMVDGLAARMAQRPNDADGWQVLARSYASLGRQAEAMAAFRHATALRPKDRKLRAELTRIATRKAAPQPLAAPDTRLAARWTPIANAPDMPLVAIDIGTMRSSVNGAVSIAPPLRVGVASVANRFVRRPDLFGD